MKDLGGWRLAGRFGRDADRVECGCAKEKKLRPERRESGARRALLSEPPDASGKGSEWGGGGDSDAAETLNGSRRNRRAGMSVVC